jgi:hypothetical protein
MRHISKTGVCETSAPVCCAANHILRRWAQNPKAAMFGARVSLFEKSWGKSGPAARMRESRSQTLLRCPQGSIDVHHFPRAKVVFEFGKRWQIGLRYSNKPFINLSSIGAFVRHRFA